MKDLERKANPVMSAHHVCAVLVVTRRGHKVPKTRIRDLSELPCRGRESNQGPPKTP